MAQPVGKIGAIARVGDDLPSGSVDVPHGDAGADHGLGGLIGRPDGIVHPPPLVAHRAEKDGAGHIAPVPPDGDKDVQHHRVSPPENRIIGAVVGVGSVGAKADQLALAGPVGPLGPEGPLHQVGQFGLGGPGMDGPDGGGHHPVVDPGCAAQGGDLLGVLAHPGLIHRG